MNKRFAIPTLNGELTAHFGHCEKFAIIDTENGTITNEQSITPPVHQPGVYPRYLAEQGVNVIIAGGMGQKAQDLFAQNNIAVCMGCRCRKSQAISFRLLKQSIKNRREPLRPLTVHGKDMF